MAPDLNSMPVSPRLGRTSQPSSQPASLNTSRRASQNMGPPPSTASISGPSTTSIASPSLHRSPIVSTSEQAGLPLRHPRPLTAAELYLECEKEQEAVVNRLTRELTALRAQSASVASNASHSSTSTSASLLPIDISDPNPTHQLTGSTHPLPSRRHRSSSSVSNRSAQTPAASTAPAHPQSTNIPITPHHNISQASADRAAAAAGGAGGVGGGGGSTTLSRQPSTTALGTSTTSNSARQSLELARHPHRPSISREASMTSSHVSTAAHAGSSSLPSPGAVPPPLQHADTAAYRSEMEIVKAENEALRQRVRALERALRAQRRRRDSSQSDVSAPLRAEAGAAASTTASGRPSREILEPGRGAPGLGMLSPSTSAAGSVSGVAVWAAHDGGVGGVAGPRERSESQSTTASSRRGLGVSGDDEVRVGESASSMAVGRGL